MRFKYLTTPIIIVLLVLSVPLVAAAATWSTESTPGCSQIAIEPPGGSTPDLVHILYNDPADSDKLKHAYRSGASSWTAETVDTTGTAGSLVLDSLGIPHVAFSDDSAVELKYTSSSSSFGGIWSAPETVQAYEDYKAADPPVFLGPPNPDPTHDMTSFSYINLVLDNLGRAHISYEVNWSCDASNPYGGPCLASGDAFSMRYRYDNGSAWTAVLPEAVDETNFDVPGGRYNSLALDSSNNYSLIHFNEMSSGDRHTQLLGTASATFPDNNKKDTGGFSLKIDGSNNIHVSYIFWDEGGTNTHFLRYALYDGSAWSTTDIDASTDLTAVGPTSISIDSDGNPHISYYDAGSGALKYTYYNGTAWSTPDVVVTGTMTDLSMVLDSGDYPHISYCGSSGYAHLADSDSDGVPDDSDNCPTVSNPDQYEGDGAPEGMLAYWRFDVEEGLTAYDTIDPNEGVEGDNDGEIRGASRDNGKVGGALVFTGRHDVSIDDNLNENLENVMTVELWALSDGSLPVGDWDTMIIKSSYGWDGSRYWWYDDGWGVYYWDDEVCFFVNHYLDHKACATSPWLRGDPDTWNQWSHIVGTYDGQTIRIYVDGVEGTPYDFGEPTAIAHSDLRPVLESGT